MNNETRTLIYTSLAHFTNDGTTYVYPFLLTFYADLKGANLVFLGAVYILNHLVNGFLSTPMGRIVDKVHRENIFLFIGIVIEGASLFIFTLPFMVPSTLYPAVITGLIVLGVGQTFYHPIGATVIRKAYGRDRAPHALGINGAFGSLGRAFVPSIMVAVVLLYGEFIGLSVISSFIVLVSLLPLFGLSFISRKASTGSNAKGSKVEAKSTAKKTRLERKVVIFLAIFTAIVFLKAMMARGIIVYLPTYVKLDTGSLVLSTTIITAGLVIGAFGQPIWGRMTSIFGGKFTVSIVVVFTLVFYLLFLLFNRNVTLMLITYAIFALFNYSGFPVLLGYVSQIVPEEASSVSSGLVWGMGQILGGATGTGITSLFLLFYPLGKSLYLMSIFGLLPIFLLPFLPRKETSPTGSGVVSQ
ncbi:MFS transporter [Thermoplasmatales archaeon AK]|nr:MFS transporter [Thermoplasmatales archaeon AK]